MLATILIYQRLSKPNTTINNNNEIKKVKGSTVTMEHSEGFTDKRTRLNERIAKAEKQGKTRKVKRLRKRI